MNHGCAGLNQGSAAQMLTAGQPLLKQGSEAIKPPLEDNVRFRLKAQLTGTRSRGHLRFGSPAVVQSAKNMNSSLFDYEPWVRISIQIVKEDLLFSDVKVQF